MDRLLAQLPFNLVSDSPSWCTKYVCSTASAVMLSRSPKIGVNSAFSNDAADMALRLTINSMTLQLFQIINLDLLQPVLKTRTTQDLSQADLADVERDYQNQNQNQKSRAPRGRLDRTHHLESVSDEPPSLHNNKTTSFLVQLAATATARERHADHNITVLKYYSASCMLKICFRNFIGLACVLLQARRAQLGGTTTGFLIILNARQLLLSRLASTKSHAATSISPRLIIRGLHNEIAITVGTPE